MGFAPAGVETVLWRFTERLPPGDTSRAGGETLFAFPDSA